MNFFGVSTNTEDPGPYVAAETRAIDELINQGVVERVLLKADHSGAVVLPKPADEATAQAALDTLPIAAHELTNFALIPVLGPAPGRLGTTHAPPT
jgi:hypothetical protein